ncbi:MAG: hypothetical protein KAH86_03125 [Methanosarcinales archaeon]|nr:hypothetical protein [Methanosarcinales archaeon]
MKQLSDTEKDYFETLEQNFDSHVSEYKKRKEQDLLQGKKNELEAELQRLEAYFDGCQRGEVSDLVINIDFCYAKICALRQLLDVTSKCD